jgi:hypothetical protein
VSEDRSAQRRGETTVCFLKITPDPIVRTYMLGQGAWELRTRMEAGAAKVILPEATLSPGLLTR